MKGKKNDKKKRKAKKAQKEEDEFYILNPEEIPRYSYSFTSILYNNRMNYTLHNPYQRKYIGQFVLSEKLGQGTFGIVMLGTHQITGEKVAVKILEKERILQEADKTRIEREIKILKNMHHNNIVHLYDIKETPSSLYIIMEYICGKELFDYIISKKHLSELESCTFFQQIISGIEYLGKIRVVHRDLKPENLLLDEQKNIKIVDFGLSNIYPNNELLTTACGSPCYAAPEMINGDPYIGIRVDIWSSGIVLFAMLCGYLPFEDSNNEILYKKITKGKFKTPKYLSDCCKDFLHRILNVNPEQRYNIEQIKNHPWFNIINPKINMSEGLLLHIYIVPIDENILDEMVTKLKFNEEEVRANLIANNHNHTTTTYYLLLKKKLREGKKSICDMKSKEFLNYLKNPINLLSTYGYNLKLIINMRNKKTKDFYRINNFDNNNLNNGRSLSLRTQSGKDINHKTLNEINNKQNSEKQLLEEKSNNDEIKIKTIYHKKKNNELLERINYSKKNNINNKFYGIKEENDVESNNINDNKKNNEIIEIKIKKKKKIDSTKESTNNKNSSISNNLINNNNNEQKTSDNIKKIKEYKISFVKKKIELTNNAENSISYDNKKQEDKVEDKIKKENKKEEDRDFSYDINNKNKIKNQKKKVKRKMIQKPRRTVTNALMIKKNIDKKNNYNTITERGNKESNRDKKIISKFLEKHFTTKEKKEIKPLKSLKENTEINKLTNNINKSINEKDTNNIIKITELMGRMKLRAKKNVKDISNETKEMSYKNFSKEKIYYLLTEKDKANKENSANNKNLNICIKEYNNKEGEENKKKINFSTNNSSKLVKNILKINSFKLKEEKEIKIKRAVKNDKSENNERKTREQRVINHRLFNKKGFIDTSVSFDKSPEFGRIRESTKPKKVLNIQTERKKINLKVKNIKKMTNNWITEKEDNIEENSGSSNSGSKNKKKVEEKKRKEKDNKYIKLKSKNKKFNVVKIEEENNTNKINEKELFKIKNNYNSNNIEKNIYKRNRLENNGNYSIKNNNTNINRNNFYDYNTIIQEDFHSNKTERGKNSSIKQKIKTLNTQGNFIKKLTIRKKHITSSLNESKKDIIIKRAINSSLNHKINSYNHTDKYKSNENIFYQTFINNNYKQAFPLISNIKRSIEENENENEKKETNNQIDIFKPFDLEFLFIKKLNDIKEILSKEIKLKKYKYKNKKNGYLIYKNENIIELDICKINNNCYNIKVKRSQGNYQNCKAIIKNLVSKLK